MERASLVWKSAGLALRQAVGSMVTISTPARSSAAVRALPMAPIQA